MDIFLNSKKSGIGFESYPQFDLHTEEKHTDGYVFPDQYLELEEHDRTTIELPEVQKAFAAEVLKLGKPTVIVLTYNPTTGWIAARARGKSPQEQKAENLAPEEHVQKQHQKRIRRCIFPYYLGPC